MQRDNILKNYLSFFAFFYISSVIIGIYNNYSPVPYWDMWNGYLEFFIKVQNGDTYAWIAQHNEHRILLSRILFWIDIKFFDGLSYFLLICNFFLMLSIVYLFSKIINNLFKYIDTTRYYLLLSITILTFSWIQNNNITWGFQSQFFLAHLFPLLSFYLLGKYSETENNLFYFTSLIVAILSVFTMGNGILVLPLLIVLAFIFKISKGKQLTTLLTTIITLSIYFADYTSPAGHGSLTETVLQHPEDFILFIFTYLGAPIGLAVGESKLIVSQFSGFLFIALSSYYTSRAFKEKRSVVLVFALLTFIAYIGATAFGTAGGRAVFGLEMALSSRYTTPVLMAWSSLLILSIYFIDFKKKHLSILFTIIPILFLYQQTKAFKDVNNSDKLLASLALELSINDEEYTKRVFPFTDWLHEIVKEPKNKNLSIFGEESIKGIAEKVSTKLETIPEANLIGSLDAVNILSKDMHFYRVRGWLYDKQAEGIPKNAFIVNDSKEIIGYLLTGFERNDVAKAIDDKAKYSGFYGYLTKNFNGNDFYIVDVKSNKKLNVLLNRPLYDIMNNIDYKTPTI